MKHERTNCYGNPGKIQFDVWISLGWQDGIKLLNKKAPREIRDHRSQKHAGRSQFAIQCNFCKLDSEFQDSNLEIVPSKVCVTEDPSTCTRVNGKGKLPCSQSCSNVVSGFVTGKTKIMEGSSLYQSGRCSSRWLAGAPSTARTC